MAFYLKTESASPKTHGRRFSCQPENAYRVSRVKDPGLRFYSAPLGKWISRDSIRERGGLNLYAHVSNDPISLFDYLGLKCVKFVTPDAGKYKDVQSISDVAARHLHIIGAHGFFDEAAFDLAFSWWHSHCIEIDIILAITINRDLAGKTIHTTGEYTGYNNHVVSGTSLNGGASHNPVYEEVFNHERAHVIAYWEVLKGKVETELDSFCDEAKYSSSESQTALKQKIKAKLEALVKDATYLQKSAQYANKASVDYFSNDQYSPVTPPVVPSPPGLEDLITPSTMNYVWQKK